jgi:hypothetical protein
MTSIEEIRKSKAKAEKEIKEILIALHAKTGFCPVSLQIEIVDKTSAHSFSPDRVIGEVLITMESV